MGESNMGKMRENPRYNVVSMRISDDERATLDEIMYITNKSVSQLMREAMEMIKLQANQGLRKAA
jgi:predicted transcriptional regulator